MRASATNVAGLGKCSLGYIDCCDPQTSYTDRIDQRDQAPVSFCLASPFLGLILAWPSQGSQSGFQLHLVGAHHVGSRQHTDELGSDDRVDDQHQIDLRLGKKSRDILHRGPHRHDRGRF